MPRRTTTTLATAAAVLFGLQLAAAPADAALCMTSDVTLTIGSTVYTPTSCADNVGNGNPSAETTNISAALGLGSGFVYLDKTDDSATPTGLGGVSFTVQWTGGGVNGAPGTWTVSWADTAGAPNLPLQVDLAVGLFGGSTGSAYFLDNVVLPVTPNSGSGTFNINFTNNGGQQPTLSHLTLLGGDPTTPPTTNVPEPTTLALFGAGLLALGAARRRRRDRAA